MSKDPRLWPLPQPVNISQTENDRINRHMANEGLSDLPFEKMIDVIMSHIYGRKDIDPDLLEQFSNKMGQLAHNEGRKA